MTIRDFHIIFQSESKGFYDSMDDLFIKNETEIYTDDMQFNKQKFFEVIDLSVISNPFVRSIVTGMLKVDVTERMNVFEVADNLNVLVRLMNLESDYEIFYERKCVMEFTKIFDHSTFELLDSDKH